MKRQLNVGKSINVHDMLTQHIGCSLLPWFNICEQLLTTVLPTQQQNINTRLIYLLNITE